MTKTFDKHPYECKFYYPHTATYTTATASVVLKAPERGDRRTKSRNQVFVKLKNGNAAVYDTGTSMSDMLTLSFEYVPQSEYAALMVFLEYVVWGANRIKYVDYKGDEYVVRVYKNEVEAVNKGEADNQSNELTQYDFSLALIDVTNNIVDTGQTAVPSQLALHIADSDHPHNPKTVATISSATAATIESVVVDAIKHVTWIVVLTSGTFAKTVLVHAVHNGTTGADATTVGTTQDTISTVGTDPGGITLSVALIGAFQDQIMALQGAKTSGSVTATVRRIKV